MQKKILLPLLFTVPALPALADVGLEAPTAGNWTADGISKDFIQESNGHVSATIGNGSVWQTISGLPKGKYVINLDGADNCVLTVKIGDRETGKVITPDKDGVYDLNGESNTITIVISSENGATGFSFSSCVLTFKEQYAEQASEYAKQIDAYTCDTPSQLIKTNLPAEYISLTSDKKTVEAQLKTYKTLLTNVEDGFPGNETGISVSELVKKFDQYNPESLSSGFEACVKAVEDYNAKVAKAETDAQTIETNKNKKAELLAEVSGPVTEALNTLKAAIKDSTIDYATDRVKKAISGFETTLAAYTAEINTAFKDAATADKLIEFESQKQALLDEIDRMTSNFNTDVADWNALQDLKALKEKVTFTYNDVSTKIQALKGVEGYENVYNDVKSGWLSTVAEVLTTANEKTSRLDGDKADPAGLSGEKGAEQKKILDDAIAEMNNDYAENEESVTTQNANMTAAQAAIADYSKRIKDAEVDVIPTSLKAAGYDATLEAANGAVAALDAEVIKEYKAHELDAESYADLDTAAESAVKALEDLAADYAAIIDLQKKLDAAKEQLTEKMPENLKPGYDSSVKGIQDAIDDLTPASTEAEVSEVAGSIENLVATYGGIIKQQEDLDKAKAELAKYAPITIDDTTLVIADKFASTVKNIQDAINKLTPENYLQVERDITKAIKELTEDATKMNEAFTTILKDLNSFKSAVQDFEGVLGEPKYFKDAKYSFGSIAATDWSSFKNSYKNEYLETLLYHEDEETKVKDGAQDKLDALKEAIGIDNPQECYEAAVKVTFDLEAQTAVLDQRKLDFINSAIAGNDAYVDGLLTDATARYDKGVADEIPGYAKQADLLKAAQDALAAARTAVEKAQAKNTYDDLYSANTKYPTVDANITSLKNALDTLDTSFANYNDLAKVIETVQGAIDKATADNENSVGDGKKHFAEVIADLQKQLDEETAKIEASRDAAGTWKDKVMDSGINNDVKATYQNALDAIKNAAAKTSTDIANNNLYFSQQQTYSASVRTQVQNIYNEIDALDHNIDEVEGWLDEVQSLIDKDLLAADQEVSKAYGEGKSFDNNAELLALYDDILAKAQKILADSDAQYASLVAEWNANFVTEKGWVSTLNDLNKTYTAAITTYNGYLYRLTNEGYMAAIDSVLKNNAELYNYSNDINDLSADELKLVADYNAAKKLLTDEIWKETVADPAATLKANINNDADNLKADVDAIAESYYSTQHAAAVKAIEDATATMEAAGLTDDQIKVALTEANQYLTDAEKGKENATNIGMDMDAIANDLDKVAPGIDLQAAAEKAWAATYEVAGKKYDELLKTASELETVKYDEDTFNTAAQDMADLNTEVEGVTEGLVNDLKSYTDRLNGILDSLESYVNKLVTADAKNIDIKKFKEEANTQYATLAETFDSFKDYVDTFSVASEMTAAVASVNTALANIRSWLDNIPASYGVSMMNVTFKNKVNAFNKALNKGYEALRDNERKLLMTWVTNAEESYNNAVEKVGETLPEYNDDINALKDDFNTLSAKWTDNSLTSNSEEFHNATEDALAEATRIYSELQEKWLSDVTGASVASVLKELNKLYDNVDGSISVAQANLEGYEQSVKDEYTSKLEDLKTELDAVKAEYEAQGSKILANNGNYKADLDNVDTEVATTIAAMEKAQEDALELKAQIAASDAQAAVLEAELKDLMTRRNDVQALLENYGQLDKFGYYLDNFDTNYQLASEWLDEATEKHTLDAESVLPYKAGMVNALNNAEYRGTRQYALEQYSVCDNLLDQLNEALANPYIIDKAQLLSDYHDILVKVTDARNSIPGSAYSEENLAAVNQAIEDFAVAAKDAQALLEKIEEAIYTPGDVDLSGGPVNAIDVQMLVNWIGDSTETGAEIYDNLLKKNPVQAYAADIMQNEQVNIADVTACIDLVLGTPLADLRMNMRSALRSEVANSIELAFIGEFNGMERYAVILNNSVALNGMQLDIKLPASASLVSVDKAERAAAHQVAVFENGSTARVMLFSLDNAAFADNNGAILYIDVNGAAPSIENAIASDTNSRSIDLGAEGTTGIIDTIMEGISNAKDVIYDAAGRIYNKMQRGINIIRHGNGKVTKEIRNNN